MKAPARSMLQMSSLDYLGEAPRLLLAQVTIEHHAHVADQELARRLYFDAVRVHMQQAVGAQRVEVGQLSPEIFAKPYAVHRFHRCEVQLEMADELRDHLAPQSIIEIE